MGSHPSSLCLTRGKLSNWLARSTSGEKAEYGLTSAHLVGVLGLDVGALAEAVGSLVGELVVLAAHEHSDIEAGNILATEGSGKLLVSVVFKVCQYGLLDPDHMNKRWKSRDEPPKVLKARPQLMVSGVQEAAAAMPKGAATKRAARNFIFAGVWMFDWLIEC